MAAAGCLWSNLSFVAFLSLLSLMWANVDAQSRPNIIFILADDLGWADVGQHNAPMHTPKIQALKNEGMFLNQSYVLPTCAPTRSSIMTARYPFRYMMQKNQIKGSNLMWLDEDFKLTPSYFKDLGYDTYMVGKWHLGSCNWTVTPLRRGFDHYRGFLKGEQDYFKHRGVGKGNNRTYDFWDDDKVDWNSYGTYATELFTTFSQNFIKNRNKEKPLFLYLAYSAPHAPFQVPEHYIKTYCSNVKSRTRAIHCGMVAALDVGVGNIVKTLQDEGLSDKTILVFLSDNGGPVYSSSFNWPLRGAKAGVWEGGVRSVTWIRAPGYLAKQNAVYPYMIHAVDWLPTLYEAAGGNLENLPDNLDGLSQWKSLRDFKAGTRTEFIVNINDKKKHVAIRRDNYKLIRGKPGGKNGWYPPPELIESGEAKWVDISGSAFKSWQWHLYDIDRDPEERTDLWDSKKDDSNVMSMQKRLLELEADSLVPYTKRPSNRDLEYLRRFWGHERPGWCNPKNSPSWLPLEDTYPGTTIRVTRP